MAFVSALVASGVLISGYIVLQRVLAESRVRVKAKREKLRLR